MIIDEFIEELRRLQFECNAYTSPIAVTTEGRTYHIKSIQVNLDKQLVELTIDKDHIK